MKYRSTVNGLNRFFSMKQYTIVWMFEIYYAKRFDVVSTMSNFKKWLIQYVNKINRKCSSADNEKIILSITDSTCICLIWMPDIWGAGLRSRRVVPACKRHSYPQVISRVPPISGARSERVKGEKRINSERELWSQSVVSIAEECGPRERERWNRGDASCKLTI